MPLVSLSETVSSFQRMLHVSPLLSHSSNSYPHSDADARNLHVQNRVLHLVENDLSLHRLHEDNNLNSRASTRSLSFRFFSIYSQLRITLEEIMQSKFGLFVHSDLVRVRNELLAKTSGLRGHRCAEHHHLLPFLGVSTKICRTSFRISSTCHLHRAQTATAYQASHPCPAGTTRCADQVRRVTHLEHVAILRDGDPTVHGDSFHLEAQNPHVQSGVVDPRVIRTSI